MGLRDETFSDRRREISVENRYASDAPRRIRESLGRGASSAPSVSFFTTGTPLPSICTYKMGAGSPIINRQIQLDSSLNLLLFGMCNIAADGLSCALHRFGGYLQAGQNLQLLAAVIEGRR